MEAFWAIATLLFIALCLCGFVCGGIAFVNQFRAIANRKDGSQDFFRRYPDLLSILFNPDQLTQRGLAARRWVIIGLTGFVAFFLSAVIVGITTGVAR